jgi:HD-GYP domain-containing protein (c-di-GMP phosphodiesterase class II)
MSAARIVVVEGPLKGRAFPLEETISIGRNADNVIHLDDRAVSRRHACVVHSGSGVVIRDLGSGNGTYVGDRRVLEYRLRHGDVIRVGASLLRFEASSHGDASANGPQRGDIEFESTNNLTMSASNSDRVCETLFAAPDVGVTPDELRDAQGRLSALYKANQIIAQERNLSRLFERVMDQLFRLIPAHNGAILLIDPRSGKLVTEHAKTGDPNVVFRISSTIVDRAIAQGEAVLIYDAAGDARFEAGQSILAQNIASAMCTPLKQQDEILGAVYVDTRGTRNAFVQRDLELLVALAGPAAIAIKNARYVQELEQAYDETLLLTASAIELRDHYTAGHTWRVTNFSVAIARELEWDETRLKECEMGGVLHDVGKIAVPDAILNKPGRLTDEEFALMKVHPEKGAHLLQDVARLSPLIPYCLYHHERYDGKGYPYGLEGEDIPIEGRVVAVADAFDAMTSSRPYRKGMEPDVAIAEIERNRGTQFDPACADALIKVYREGRLSHILQRYHEGAEKSLICPFCSTYVVLAAACEPGSLIECIVCHRKSTVCYDNGAYYGTLQRQGVTA